MSWANLDQKNLGELNNRWQSQIGGVQNWATSNPARVNSLNNWGNGVRNNLGDGYNTAFNANWWNSHPHNLSAWHYGYQFNNSGWDRWWTVPTFAAVSKWFTWQAPPAVWSKPAYYDYGQGGNVTYENDSVSVNGQQVASAEDFAQSAAELATVAPPANEEAAEKAEWMPLGTFAVSADEKDISPTRVIQLAVNKEGIVSGTLYNSQTDQATSVQGQVDKQTQRVAMRVGESDSLVVETGLYNLTQDSAPVLVHFGADKVENWLLARLENPDAGEPTTSR